MSDRYTVRLGLVGAGRWGRNLAAAIAELDEVRLAWIVDRNLHAAAEFGNLCPVLGSWQEAIARGGADGVIVATPPRFHGEIARDALAAGLPVLIEKPLTANPTEARDLLGRAESSGLPVWVDHRHLFAPAYGRLKKVAADLGPIRRIRSNGGSWGPFRVSTPVLWDWAPHDVALCLDLVGMAPASVAAKTVDWRDTDEGPGEILALILDFPNGCQAEIEVGNIFRKKRRRFEAQFDGAALIFDDLAENKLLRRAEYGGVPSHQTIPVAGEPALTYAVIGFANAIRTGATDLAQLRLGAQVVEVLAACEELLAR